MAHTNAIFSPPGTGGILLEEAAGDFRIDHDQKFNATTNLQYTSTRPLGAWAALSWRYDSGLVAGSVGSIDDALALTGDQQAAIGFFCGSTVATRDAPITSCASGGGATRLMIPAEGTEDDVTNPPRIAPRHLFDLGFGVDNLFHGDKAKVRLRFSVINLTNKEALYNFLSTFSGTHFVTPRAYQVHVGGFLLGGPVLSRIVIVAFFLVSGVVGFWGGVLAAGLRLRLWGWGGFEGCYVIVLVWGGRLVCWGGVGVHLVCAGVVLLLVSCFPRGAVVVAGEASRSG